MSQYHHLIWAPDVIMRTKAGRPYLQLGRTGSATGYGKASLNKLSKAGSDSPP